MVYDARSARETRVYNHSQEIAGEFMVQATANPGHSLEELEREIMRQVADIRDRGVDERELERSKNRIQASHVFQLERFGGFSGRADQLNYYNIMAGRPRIHQRRYRPLPRRKRRRRASRGRRRSPTPAFV